MKTTHTPMEEMDARCNALSRKLEAMKAAKQDGNDNLEYMQTLYDLRDACRARAGNLS